MLIKQILHEAFENDDINLQALIMFLVFEKEVLSMEDDKSKLDLYFLPKHEERMGSELTVYKKKMKMKEAPTCYRLETSNGETLYVKADGEQQARAFVLSLNYQITTINITPDSQLMSFNGKNITMKEIMKDKPSPYLIGVNAIEQKYNWRNQT